MTAPMLSLQLQGLGFWATRLTSWPAARAAFRGETTLQPDAPRRPAPALLPAAERRRAPDSVALALQVAAEAVAAAGVDPAHCPSVFTSAYGDLALLDNLCSTLAQAPALLSPTRFHNSVHNAAAGYWTIATGCRAPSSAVSAWRHSFAAGLLEAATQCLADHTPVLLVACDAPSAGAMASVASSEGLLGVAMVLAPPTGSGGVARLALQAAPSCGEATHAKTAAARAQAGNAMADALPLCEALAAAAPATVQLLLGRGSALQLQLSFESTR